MIFRVNARGEWLGPYLGGGRLGEGSGIVPLQGRQ